MTVPTISQIKGNTLLELFKNGYNSIKESVYSKDETDEIVDAVANEIPDMTLYYEKTETYSKEEVNTRLADKQNKLIAGDNIVIDETTNTISAIEGGSLDNYYTKSETDTLLNAKADASDVYDKTETYSKSEVYAKSETYSQAEIGTLLANNGYKIINTITPTVVTSSTAKVVQVTGLQDGDIVQITLSSNQRTTSSTDYTYGVLTGGMFVYKQGINTEFGGEVKLKTLSSGATTNYISTVFMELSDTTDYLQIRAIGERIGISNGEFTKEATYASEIAVSNFVVIRRA